MTTGAALLAITLIALPGTLGTFLNQLPANVRFMQIDHPYVWERHATLKAFFRLLFQGRGAGEPTTIVTLLSLGTVFALGGYLLATLWRTYRSPAIAPHPSPDSRSPTPDAIIAATIAAMPLLMPFYFDYDLLLLAIPVTLFAASCVETPSLLRRHSLLIKTLIALYLWSEINPGIAGSTRVNLDVPLLTAAAIGLISCARGQRATNSEQFPAEAITLPARVQAA
jgi:hypothetical protein